MTTEHPLRTYLSKHKIPPYIFADQVGLSRIIVYDILNDKYRDMKLTTTAIIEGGTNRRVTMQKLYNHLLDNGLLRR